MPSSEAPIEPPVPADPAAPSGPTDAVASSRPWLPWTAAGTGVVVVALVVSLVFLNGGGPKGHPVPSGSGGTGSPGGTDVQNFAFAGAKVTMIRISKKVAAPDVGAATDQIQALLSRLYEQGVVGEAQTNRPGGPPASFWNAFAPAIRQRAQTDRLAFTLGSTAGSLQGLSISSSRLTIRFLIDEKGAVASAVAATSIRGSGQIPGSGPVNLVATGTFVFADVSGTWLIVGYPSAAVTVASPGAPSPGAPTSTGTPSTGPSGSVTP